MKKKKVIWHVEAGFATLEKEVETGIGFINFDDDTINFNDVKLTLNDLKSIVNNYADMKSQASKLEEEDVPF